MELKKIVEEIYTVNNIAQEYVDGVKNENTILIERLVNVSETDTVGVDDIIAEIKSKDTKAIVSIVGYYVDSLIDYTETDYDLYLHVMMEREFHEYFEIFMELYNDIS